MTNQSYYCYVERIEPEKNMARFYALDVQPTLFGDISLLRCWGRIGTRGQQKEHIFEKEKYAIELFLELLCEKRKRGYSAKPNRATPFN